MSDPTAHDGSSPATTRRDFIRNSALATGALWAAPAILNVGPAAFGAEGSGRTMACSDEGLRIFRYKLSSGPNQPGRFDVTTRPVTPGEPHLYDRGCGLPGTIADVNTAIANGGVVVSSTNTSATIDGGAIGVTEATVDGTKRVTFTIPRGCDLLDVQAKGGRDEAVECDTILSPDVANNRFTIALPTRNVQFVTVLLCCAR